MGDPNPAQAFSFMSEEKREKALADPNSPIRRFFEDTLRFARSARYVVVIPYAPLASAFQEHVLAKLDARPAKGFSATLPIYELGPSSDRARRPAIE